MHHYMTTPQTLTVEQAAKVLGIGLATAYSAIHRGEIPSIRIGDRLLVPKPALERMLRCERESAPAAEK